VYAGKRQLRADAAVDAKTVYTARWSLRRWPEQLAGVVAAGPTVISRWSDGELVAIDGRTGEIAWRAEGPPAPGFAGQLTGAGTVWQPPGLHVAAGIVVVNGGQKLAGYDVSTGTRRWQTPVPAGCADGFTTAGGQYVCPAGGYDTGTGAAIPSWPAGPYTPVGCEAAASRCAGLRDGAGQGWLTDTRAPRRSAPLDRPGSTVAAGLIFYPSGGALEAADPSGSGVRRYPDAQVLGVSEGNVVLLTPGRHLLEVDPRAGATVADFPLAVGSEELDWSPGGWQVVDGHVAIERLSTGGYFSTETVIVAAL
jgi:hypothetical protein